MDGITDSMDVSLSKLLAIVKNREAWQATVHGVAELDMTAIQQQQGYGGFPDLHYLWEFAQTHVY